MKSVNMTIAIALLAVWGGCATDHRMRGASEPKMTVCRECYDEAVRVWDTNRYVGARWSHAPSWRPRGENQCAYCKATMVVHTEDGRWTIQCPTCAPEGVPCDRCLPGDVLVQPTPGR